MGQGYTCKHEVMSSGLCHPWRQASTLACLESWIQQDAWGFLGNHPCQMVRSRLRERTCLKHWSGKWLRLTQDIDQWLPSMHTHLCTHVIIYTHMLHTNEKWAIKIEEVEMDQGENLIIRNITRCHRFWQESFTVVVTDHQQKDCGAQQPQEHVQEI